MDAIHPLPVTIRAYLSEAGEAWTSAVYQNLPCGCTVAGNGTTPHPLTPKLCEVHAAANPPVPAPTPRKGQEVRPGDLIRRRGNGPAGYVVRWPRDREDWTPLNDGSDEWVVTWFLNEGATGRDTDTELCCAAEFEVVGRIPGYDPGRPSPSRDTKQPS